MNILKIQGMAVASKANSNKGFKSQSYSSTQNAVNSENHGIISKDASKALAAIAFTSNPLKFQPKTVETMLSQVPIIKNEASKILEETAILIERIKKGDKEGLVVNENSITVLDEASEYPVRVIGLLNNKVEEFSKYNLKGKIDKSFFFDNGELSAYTEHTPNTQNRVHFDFEGNVTSLTAFSPEKNIGILTNINGGKVIDSSIYTGEFGYIKL